MARGKPRRASSGAAPVGVFAPLAPILCSEVVPGPAALLDLGRELDHARLSPDFISRAIPSGEVHAAIARDLLGAAIHYHRTKDEGQLRRALARIAGGTPWLCVRDELGKFSGRAAEELAARSPVPLPEEESQPKAEAAREYYVTLDQAGALVNRGKRTMEKLKKRMPKPVVRGGGGKAAEWKWSELRPWLEQEFAKQLPEIPPHSVGR